MDNIKNTETHIQEIEELLNDFNNGYEHIFEKMKKKNLKSLKDDIHLYQKEWKKNFNQELKNNKTSKNKFDLLEFKSCDLLKTDFSDVAKPKIINKKKGKSKLLNFSFF